MCGCVQVGKLSPADTVRLLVSALHTDTDVIGPRAKTAARRQVCSHAALRLVRGISPLHTFLETPHRRDVWCGLPLEVVEVSRFEGDAQHMAQRCQ